MSDYNVKFTDTNKTPILVEQDAQKSTETDLVLFGRSFLEYGEQLNENLVKILENFACSEMAAPPEAGDWPDTDLTVNETLTEPLEGQLWYNTTKQALYNYNGTMWIPLVTGSDYAANWGQVTDGTLLPRPVAQNGYVFPYSECIWIVSPAGHGGRFDYMACTTDEDAQVLMRYRLLGDDTLTSGTANYLIIGIRGNTNNGTIVVDPPIYVEPSPTPGASPTPAPSSTRPPTPTPTNTRTATPTISLTRTPVPSASRTPPPTPSPRPALAMNIVDSARGGDYVDSISLCNMGDYISTLDVGNQGCTVTIGNCTSGACAPEPGDFSTGDVAIGAAMGITVTGGTAPYTVRFKTFTATSGAAAFAASGDCLFIGGSSGFSTLPSGTVYSFIIPTDGGSQDGITINASCGDDVYTLTGNFTVEVTDSVGTIISETFPYTVERKNEAACYDITDFRSGFMLSDSNGGSSSCDGSAMASSGTPTNWLAKTASVNYTSFNSNVGAPSKVIMSGIPKWWPRPAARVTLTITHPLAGSAPVTVTAFRDTGRASAANGVSTGTGSVTIGAHTYTVTLSITVGYTGKDQIDGVCNDIYYYNISPSFTISPAITSCSALTPPGGALYDGGGGGGCVTTESMIYGSGLASGVMVGATMTVIDPSSLELGTGIVSLADIKLQPCVRITSESGVVLECSTTAPIANSDGVQVLAPDLLGVEVLVYDNGVVRSEKVVSVEDIGDKEVVHITVENNYFLAGAEDGRYFFHHNIKNFIGGLQPY